jgi:GNAT superfamily N-acetyltransferase
LQCAENPLHKLSLASPYRISLTLVLRTRRVNSSAGAPLNAPVPRQAVRTEPLFAREPYYGDATQATPPGTLVAQCGRTPKPWKAAGMNDLERLIRPCRDDEHNIVLAIINNAAQRYRGVIPEDRWHDPYFSAEYLATEIAAGVRFFGCEIEGELLGVMGVQDVADVTLIRHAYVLPRAQRAGIGGDLLRWLLAKTDKPVLIGTWADAGWAIAFYEKHGFARVSVEEKTRLLRRYWDIPKRQVETSVVLAERRP